MAKPSSRDITRALLARYGQTFAEELKIKLGRESPSALYQLLVASLLMSARIRSSVAIAAARSLFERGWTTPQKMSDAGWRSRTKTLNEAGYARYDERTSTMLGDASQLLLERYGGDLRKLRSDAGRNPDAERKLLKQFKGIGDVGVDIFFREIQVLWDEIFPFTDKRVVAGARRLGLGEDANALSRLVPKKEFARLATSLVRVELEGDHDEVIEQAGNA